MMLRDYQQRAIDQLYAWFEAGNKGHPCLVLPTGSGKSHIVAALAKDAIQSWPETRILMLTHVKELIEQNAEKMLLHWPGAPLGIYSAGIGKRQLGESITFGSIQSLRDRAKDIGHVDLCIVDECHLINHKNKGGYRHLLGALETINPAMRVVGLTATPYRLGHGLIVERPALFDALIEPVTIMELVDGGYLSPLRSKLTTQQLDVSGVHKRGGEFIESELQAAVDTEKNNQGVVQEVIELAGGRKAWLFFCVGVDHAHNVANELRARGVAAECITGETSKKEREEIIKDFKAGKLRALTNANVLTTGFDYPDIDLIAMLRPTMSPGLYVQMAGRGMRVKSHTDHCMVLDFAGVVGSHGPITRVSPPRKPGEGKPNKAPFKVCKVCKEIVHTSVQICPSCGTAFAPPEEKKLKLHDDDIMGNYKLPWLEISGWKWRPHISRTSGKEMLCCTYYPSSVFGKVITEYLPVLHEGYAGQKALILLADISNKAGAKLSDEYNVARMTKAVSCAMNNSNPPARIRYSIDGKFHRVIERIWEKQET